MYLMTAYCTLNDGIIANTVNDTLFYKNKVDYLHYTLQSLLN